MVTWWYVSTSKPKQQKVALKFAAFPNQSPLLTMVLTRSLVVWLLVITWSRGEICSSRDNFISVFSTRTKFHPGIKNPCKTLDFFNFCPGPKWHFSVPPYVWSAVNDHTVHVSLRQRRPFCCVYNWSRRMVWICSSTATELSMIFKLVRKRSFFRLESAMMF